MWALSADRVRIRREFVTKDFVTAMAFLNAAATIAEDQGHHPDLHARGRLRCGDAELDGVQDSHLHLLPHSLYTQVTGYRNVAVELYTHSVGGLTENDFIVAQLLDGVKVAYSPKWLEAHPAAAGSAQT